MLSYRRQFKGLLKGCCYWQPHQLRHFKVTVVGANGGIGQPLSLLLKMNKLVTKLVLHDIKNSIGLSSDLGHISTEPEVQVGATLEKAVQCADLVILPAGMPRKPGMKRDQLFDANANAVIAVANAVAEHAPTALFAIITNPVNSMVPMAAEILKEKGVYDPRRLFGVTTLDVVRSETFMGDFMNVSPQKVKIPVVGGHAGITILPLLSQCKPIFRGDEECAALMTKRIQEAGTEVVKAKAGSGSATLSMAYAAARFANVLLLGLKGEKAGPECAYVDSDVADVTFFASPLTFGPKGIEENLGLPPLNDMEREALEKMLPVLEKDIQMGIRYVQQ